MSGRSRLVAELADAQFGVVTWAQLRGLGVPESTIADWAREGRLVQLFPGVYAVGHSVLRWEGRLMAAVLFGGEGAVISHRTAAAWWGLRQTSSPVVHLTVPNGRGRRAGIRWHRSVLAPEDVTAHEGVPVTSLGRTALDMAALLDARGLTRLLVRADKQDNLDANAFRDAYRRCPGHRGGSRLIRALDAYLPDLVHTRSGVEVDVVGVLLAAGLPRPSINGWVDTDIGRLEVDYVWRRQRVALEVDTFDTHGDRTSFERDRRRDQALIRTGWSVLRTTDVAIAERPAEFIAAVLELLTRSS